MRLTRGSCRGIGNLLAVIVTSVTLVNSVALSVVTAQGTSPAGTGQGVSVCYQHKETKAMLYECTEFQSPNAATPEILCFDTERKLKKFRFDAQIWERINGQHVDCKRAPQSRDIPKEG